MKWEAAVTVYVQNAVIPSPISAVRPVRIYAARNAAPNLYGKDRITIN